MAGMTWITSGEMACDVSMSRPGKMTKNIYLMNNFLKKYSNKHNFLKICLFCFIHACIYVFLCICIPQFLSFFLTHLFIHLSQL